MTLQATQIDRPLTISEVTAALKEIVEGVFPTVWVAGEISDLSRPRSGHLYFTLKDDQSQIRGVMWRSTAERLNFDVCDGQAVLCYGSLEVYAARGTCQFMVRKMQPEGVGALQLALEQLRGKLQREGLFDASRKRTLPRFPSRVGIVTSTSGAALRDFLEASRDRYAATEIVVIPAIVQGEQACGSIVAGLRAAAQIQPPLDVVIVSRGGGSLEDLWCFNEEPVVRAVAACPIPTVSAIGHEIDVTLCDLAADVRALTPTDAAIRVFEETQSMLDLIDAYTNRLTGAIRSAIRQRVLQLDSLQQRPILRSPFELIRSRAQTLDDFEARARRAIQVRLQASAAEVAKAAASLTALSPLAVLVRGYSMTTDQTDHALTGVGSVKIGDEITTRLSDGTLRSRVHAIHPG